MDRALKIGCVMMAAGNGSRFGSNKLAAEFHGQSLFAHALSIIPPQIFTNVIVVTQYHSFMDEICAHSFRCVLNEHPDWGQSHTLQLGLRQLLDCDGVMFMVADQPLLQQKSLEALTTLWRTQPDKIAALSAHGKRGNPCLFPSCCFSELLQIQGDRGGSCVIRAQPEKLLLLEVPEAELFDVDTVQSFQQLSSL